MTILIDGMRRLIWDRKDSEWVIAKYDSDIDEWLHDPGGWAVEPWHTVELPPPPDDETQKDPNNA